MEGRPNDVFLTINRNITLLKPTEPFIPTYFQKTPQVEQIEAGGDGVEAKVVLALPRKLLLHGAVVYKRLWSSASRDALDQDEFFRAFFNEFPCPIFSQTLQVCT